VTGLGWSGRGGGWAAGGFEQVEPFLAVVPVLGEVHGEVAAAVAGDASRDGDELAADGGAAGPWVEAPGQGPGGAGQVRADGGQGEPRGAGREMPGGQVSEWPSLQSAKVCSTTAWSRCCASAWIIADGEPVKTAW